MKPPDPASHVALRDEFYERVRSGSIGIAEAVKMMRRLSRLTQHEFAAHRGISVQALRQIESGRGNPTVDTLNKVAGIFSLEVGFVPKRRKI